MTVSVAIDLALDRLFTYEVPEALKEKLAIGQLLSVPFGHREARGFAMAVEENQTSEATGLKVARSSASRPVGRASSPVGRASSPCVMEGVSSHLPGRGRPGHMPNTATVRSSTLSSSTPTNLSLKPITAIVDETPFFSPALLELVKKVAAYTAAPVESVLKAAVPAAVLKKNARPRELLYVDRASSPCGQEDGSSPLPGRGRPGHGQDGLATAAVGQGLSKRQQWLLEQIERLGGGWLQQLCTELKTTPATLRELALRGLVTITARARRRDPLGGRRVLPTKPWPLNAEQAAALEAIVGKDNGQRTEDKGLCRLSAVCCPKPLLLFGVTGSGKTEVYLQAIARELEAGRGAIVMVPEISLTPQTVQRFASRFGDRVAVLHSALSDGERYDEWHRIRSGEARVVVGPRSAVWAPVRDLGLIVVDEEHESSYKQEDNPRYHARDVAVLRGAIEGARVVLGSATPSLESWMNVRRGKYALAEMKSRAGAGRLPDVHLVDMRLEGRDARATGNVGTVPSGGAIFSRELLEAIRLRLDRNEQTILFLNRRGYSRSMTCEACGAVVECPNCSLADHAMPYTYHQADNCLRCHVCGGWIPPPTECPKCHARAFSYRGIGTQRAEAALARCFPRARIIRMDADSTSRKNSHDDLLGAFRRQEADVLIGTQMIAKGLDFPNVTLVGVLNADSSLYMPDFRAAERTFQLLSQVAGRAGRAELPGEVFIQTYDPDVPAIQSARRNDYVQFAERELKDRAAAHFPPFCHLACLNFRSRDGQLVGEWARMYAASLAKVRGLEVSEAMPSALEKAEGWFRWQIVVRAPTAGSIVKAWRWILSERPPNSHLHIAVDIDAHNLV